MTFALPYFSIPEMMIHTAGQLADASLFIYLINHFFFPRNPETSHRKHAIFSAFFSFLLLFWADVLSGGNYYLYYAMLLLIPFLYSICFFQEGLLYKIVISSVFTLLVLSFENLTIQINYQLPSFFQTNTFFYLSLFFIRRIGCKILLFFLLRNLLLWTREYNISIPDSCWFLLLLLSLGDNLVFLLQIPQKAGDWHISIPLTVFLILVPIFLLMTVKYLSISAEKNRVISALASQEKIQNQYLRQQLDMSDSLRKFRHDYKAHLFCMDTLLENGKYEELHQYLFSLHQYQYEGIHLRRFTDDASLNILLNQKASAAEKYGVTFSTDISFPTDGKILISDLNSLISNLCDNAIEACATLPEAHIDLSIHKVKAYLIITVSNTCNGDVCRNNPGFRTHKSNPEFHGLGLKIIKSIVEKYHGNYKVSSTETLFITNLMLLDE